MKKMKKSKHAIIAVGKKNKRTQGEIKGAMPDSTSCSRAQKGR